jgi:protein TonB
VLGGALSGVFAAPPVATAAPKLAAPAAPSAPTQIRVGGEVEAALLTHQVVPLYPDIAKNSRIEGTVRLSAIIGPDGTVKNLRVISGNPLLVDAAQNAVKQWVYRPTYLNGNPVEVITEIVVQFHLHPRG